MPEGAVPEGTVPWPRARAMVIEGSEPSVYPAVKDSKPLIEDCEPSPELEGAALLPLAAVLPAALVFEGSEPYPDGAAPVVCGGGGEESALKKSFINHNSTKQMHFTHLYLEILDLGND